MDQKEVERRVVSVVARVLKVDPKEVTAGSNFAFDLGADSMTSVALVAGFEEEFDIELEEEKAREVQTVGEAVVFIARHLSTP